MKCREVLVKFSAGLPDVRKQIDMSQSELGEKIGVSRQTISNIERGNVQLTWSTFLAISMLIMINNDEVFQTIFHNTEYGEALNELKKNKGE